MNNASRAGRIFLAVSTVAILAGCSALLDPQGASEQAHLMLPTDMSGDQADTADQAMAALSRGDTATAEKAALRALQTNPKDAYALLAAGLTFQATGRYDQAKQYFDVIVSNQMPGTIMLPGENGVVQPRSLVDVAKANLAVIEKITGRSRGTMFDSGRGAAGPAPSDAETNVASRFRILKRLLDLGLLTPEEYARRRAANLGALLPFSAPPPARGLERPVPSDAAVIDRLHALATAVENREMSAAAEGEERGVILDALLPAQPAVTALPPLPPKDMLEEGQAIGRLQRMLAAGLVTPEEAAQEKAGLDHAYETQLAGAQVEGTATGLRYGSLPPVQPAVTAQSLAAANGTTWGVSLSRVKTQAAASKEWERIRGHFPEELGSRQFTARRVDLRGGAVRWRVIAGPLTDKEQAVKLCRTLKLHRQACDPVTY
jgi:hypothetical protein